MPFLFTLPVTNQLPWYKFRISLSGVLYTTHFRFNTRMQRWMMDIMDASDNPVLQGVPMLIERNLIGQYDTLSLPPGVLFCTDDSGEEQQPTLYSFGLDHSAWYEDPTQ